MIEPIGSYILFSAIVSGDFMQYQEIACSMAIKDGIFVCGDMFIGSLLPEKEKTK